MHIDHWLQLSLTDGLGPILARRLVGHCGSVADACGASQLDLEQIEGIGHKGARSIYESLRQSGAAVEVELAKCKNLGITLLCPDDDAFPVMLRSIHDPPLVLYVQGSLEPRDLNAIAIVGSRNCSHYGREQADRFASLLAGAGFTIVSGGARGVDSAAHRGALAHPDGRTLAVVGSGLDVPYPPENAGFFKEIAKRGAVISEFALGTPPNAQNFPRRNRIVSGLSRGVFVIEANIKSGALITARTAADDHNRPVFALPGRVDNALSAGPHHLIRDGAILVRSIEDIIDNLGPLPQEAVEDSRESGSAGASPSNSHTSVEQSPAVTRIPLTDRQQLVVAPLAEGPLHVDQIIQTSDLDAPVVLQELTYLSLKGVVKRLDGHTYSLTKSHRI